MQHQVPPVSLIDEAKREKETVASTSVLAALFLTFMKLVVGLVTGSLGILAEAAHSGLDLVAAFITYLAVRISDKPANDKYPYGHGKVENISALIETLLLLVTCIWIIYEAVQRLFFQHIDINVNVWAFLTMAISILIDVNRSRMLYAAARKHNSQALEADALHFSTDVWSSSVVMLGLFLVWLGKNVFPDYMVLLSKADAVAALGVALIVIFVSYKLGKRTIEVLLDRAPIELTQQIVHAARKVDGVLDMEKIRVRRSGPRVFVDMNISIDRNLSFEQSHAIAEAVKTRVQNIVPGADVVIHADPRVDEQEGIAERIRAVASSNRLAVHSISVYEVKGQVYVDFHLEVDDSLTLQEAHELASHMEKDVCTEIPNIHHVNTHIESKGAGMNNSQDVTLREDALVSKIKKSIEDIAGDSCCHKIVVRRHGNKYSVLLHCTFDENLSIIQVHEISTHIENHLKDTIPALESVLIHAEPEDE